MRLFPLLICLFGLSTVAQVKISGKFYDEFNEPISDVTVLAMKAKDSTMIAYTSSKEMGDFSLSFQPVKDSVNITFSAFGFAEQVKKYPNIN
ncbi:MAG TPA: carboxypeptidase-like regulatory domain-containing protein, partial [Flavobacterium sp.]|nr:carboxypeptidase-like regulatory domain-containing protein [Flavobacterium sp.]